MLTLVDNARLHAHPRALVISTASTDDRVTINVADKGPGLTATFEEGAFRQFVHGAGGGSGLGLSIVRGIARAHGGDVRYRRTTGHSTFKIILPRRG